MLAKRIIPCLDIKDGRTVKGTNFIDLRDAGDAVELAARYAEQGADELVFLDITATNEKRRTFSALVEQVATAINIPFTVGGGINSVADIENLLAAGADKISINSAAVSRPQLIEETAKAFGAQCIVAAIDAKFVENDWMVFLNGGRIATEMKVFDWARQVAALGAGEILLTSIDTDGRRRGFAVELTHRIAKTVSIPVIASGGAGRMEDFARVFEDGYADAALAAGVFHFGEIEIPALKKFLRKKKFEVRL